MDTFDNHAIQLTEPNVTDSGTFALVYGGKKHRVSKERAGLASMTVMMRGMIVMAVNKAQWDSIPEGDKF